VLVYRLRIKLRIGLLRKVVVLSEGSYVVFEGDIHAKPIACVFHALLEGKI
jgi:hypothetical protein